MLHVSILGVAGLFVLIAWVSRRIQAPDGSQGSSFRFSWWRSSFEKRPEPRYTEDHKINRHWKPFS